MLEPNKTQLRARSYLLVCLATNDKSNLLETYTVLGDMHRITMTSPVLRQHPPYSGNIGISLAM